jgi:hypothetical protein
MRVECLKGQGHALFEKEKCDDQMDRYGGDLGVGIISSGRSACASSNAG